MPQSPPATIVHGDYRLGNTMLAHGAPARLIAILDWEMATIGDPLADIGYMMLHWVQPARRPAAFTLQSVTHLPGFPTRQELIALYEERSGRSMQSLELVRRAGAMEGGRVHGGQLQARDHRARPTTRT